MGKFPHGPQYKNLRIHFDVTTRIETERYQDATACSPCLFVLGCCFSPACCEQKQLKQCHPFSSEEIFHFHLLPLLSHWWTESCLVSSEGALYVILPYDEVGDHIHFLLNFRQNFHQFWRKFWWFEFSIEFSPNFSPILAKISVNWRIWWVFEWRKCHQFWWQ